MGHQRATDLWWRTPAIDDGKFFHNYVLKCVNRLLTFIHSHFCVFFFVITVCSPGDDESKTTQQLYGEIKPAVDGATYIVKHMHNKSDYKEVILKSLFLYFGIIYIHFL